MDSLTRSETCFLNLINISPSFLKGCAAAPHILTKNSGLINLYFLTQLNDGDDLRGDDGDRHAGGRGDDGYGLQYGQLGMG